MNKRQKKKLEIKNQLDKMNEEITNLRNTVKVFEIGWNFLEVKLNINKENINNIIQIQSHMQLEDWSRMKELEEKQEKLKEENSILIEEQKKQGKRITGIYIMILVVILLEVIQWWMLHV